MDNIRTLMYGWEFPPRISGGLGVACYAIVQELAKKGVLLTLILPQILNSESLDGVNLLDYTSDLSDADRTLFNSIKIRYPEVITRLSPYINSCAWQHNLHAEARRELFTILDKMGLSQDLNALILNSLHEDKYAINLLFEVLRYALFAGSLAKDVEHDVIHAHDWLTILAALVARGYSNKPVVFHVHALETDRSGFWVDKRVFAIEKYGLEQADKIIAVSQYTKNNIVQYYGIAPEKITVIHNGIYISTSSAKFKKTTEHNMVLFLGRITHQKGPYFFIEVAKRVLEKKPDVHFVLVGAGDLMTSMIERVAALRLGKNIHFTGFLTGENVRDIYELADVYVMPSVSEPFGLSALEAVSYDVPAVISKQSGVAEVLHHALVSDFWDTDDMAAKILALLDYNALRKTSLKGSQDNLQDLSWEKAAEKILQLYQKLIIG